MLEAVKKERDSFKTKITELESAAELAKLQAEVNVADLNVQIGTLKGQVAAREAEKSSANKKRSWW